MGHAVYFNYSALLESFTVEYYVKMVVMRQAIAELVFASVLNDVFAQNVSDKNEFSFVRTVLY